MKSKLIFSTFSLGLLFSTYSAASPSVCHSGIGKRTFDNAYESRTLQLRNEWKQNFDSDCGDQVRFEMIYASDFLRETGPAIRKCRNAGRNAATELVVNEISRDCRDQGQQHGGEDGAFFAREYCQIHAIFLVPEGNYEPAYEESCSATYIHVAESLCPDKVADDPFFDKIVAWECEL